MRFVFVINQDLGYKGISFYKNNRICVFLFVPYDLANHKTDNDMDLVYCVFLISPGNVYKYFRVEYSHRL